MLGGLMDEIKLGKQLKKTQSKVNLVEEAPASNLQAEILNAQLTSVRSIHKNVCNSVSYFYYCYCRYRCHRLFLMSIGLISLL